VNVVFVSNCDFRGNSAPHVFSVANELQTLGVESVVFVPNSPQTVGDLGTSRFRVLHYDKALRQPIVFPDGRGPDLIHAWTPRECVRRLTEALALQYSVPYVVHLEDNEEVIMEDELGGPSFADLGRLPLPLIDELVPAHRSHPVHYPAFLANAAGVTVLMDRLLEFKPAHVPGVVFWPGFDAAFADIQPDRLDVAFRRSVGLTGSDRMVVYTGDVHASNRDEVGSLIAAIAAVRRRGAALHLVKTGCDRADIPYFDAGKTEGFIIDLGLRPRADIARLIETADVLVQPGRAGGFNDYRFPSNVPEYLVSGKPVLLPRTNIGRFLRDDVDCILLQEGHALEIAAKLEPLLDDAERRRRIGAGGRSFALRELTWRKGAARVKEFYSQVLSDVHVTAAPMPTSAAARAVEPPTASSACAEGDWYAKLIAFYLPQFHTIKENDEWWGEGFTEWTNVRRAEPNYAGHYQPQVPAELGYYDLREPAVLDRQAELARAYGIRGFCFYYYWFNGRRLLEGPLDQMLARSRPDFPFCICWANENWTRRWDGSENEVLIEQDFSEYSAEQFIRDVIPIFEDRRYIKVGEAPILLVYRVDLLPDAAAAAHLWREVCADEGIPEIHLVAVQSFGISDPRPYGFDAAVGFPPHGQYEPIDPRTFAGISEDFRGDLRDYVKVARNHVRAPQPPFVRYGGVMPAWDNTPRRMNRALIYVDSTPAAYQTWLEQIVEQTMARSAVQEPLVFLNAWNEWGEGAYLEPDQRNGAARLEATKRGLCRGMHAHFQRRGFRVTEEMVERALADQGAFTSSTCGADRSRSAPT
jgi:glycosyltransferase involved in cell wall biosynthesis